MKFQDEYHCPITPGEQRLIGWDKGAKDASNIARHIKADDDGQEIACLAKTGKK